MALLREALASRPPGRFALMAAIAAVHDESGSWSGTDWQEILGLYDLLMERWPSPVVRLNRAIALGFAAGPAEGLAELDALGAEPQLARYPYLAAARGDFLVRLGRPDEARVAFEEALILTENEAEQRFLRAPPGRTGRLTPVSVSGSLEALGKGKAPPRRGFQRSSCHLASDNGQW